MKDLMQWLLFCVIMFYLFSFAREITALKERVVFLTNAQSIQGTEIEMLMNAEIARNAKRAEILGSEIRVIKRGGAK